MLAGNLIVRPISAQFQHKKELFDKADPYCKVTIGSQVEKTDVCKNQSTNPSWSSNFTFNNVNLGTSILRFDIYDKNVLIDSSLGSAEVALNNLSQINNRFNGWIQLFHHNNVCGSLLIELEFLPIQSQMKNLDTGFQSYQPVYQTVSTTGGIPTTYTEQGTGFNQGFHQTTGNLQGQNDQLYNQGQGFSQQQQSGQFLSGQQGFGGVTGGLTSGSSLTSGSGLSTGGISSGYTGGLGSTGYTQSGTLGQSLGQQLNSYGQQLSQGLTSGGLSNQGLTSQQGLHGVNPNYGQSLSQQLGSKIQQAGNSLGQSVSHMGQGSGQQGQQFGTGYTQYKQ